MYAYRYICIYIYRVSHGKESLCIFAPTFSIFGLSTETFFLNTSSWSQLSRDSFKFSVAPIVTSQFSSEKNFPKIKVHKIWGFHNLDNKFSSSHIFYKNLSIFKNDMCFGIGMSSDFQRWCLFSHCLAYFSASLLWNSFLATSLL